MIVRADHDVFRLQVAVDNALAVNVVEGIAQGESNADGALGRKFLLFVQDLAQQAAVHPFQNHVAPAAIFVVEYPNDAGMIELFADIFFPFEPVEEDRVGFHFRMRNLDRDRPAVAHVRAAENRCHAASGDQAIDAVMIELIAGMEFTHWEGRSAANTERAANLYQYSL